MSAPAALRNRRHVEFVLQRDSLLRRWKQRAATSRNQSDAEVSFALRCGRVFMISLAPVAPASVGSLTPAGRAGWT